jgi:predicted negative regulator of RcsB-dependent stress response
LFIGVADWSDGFSRDVAGLAHHQRRSTGRCFVRFAFPSSRSWSFVLTASAGLLASGCAGNKGGVGSSDLNSPLASKAEKSGFQMNGEPTYASRSQEYQNRPLVAPGMGLDKKAEPSTMQKVGSSIAAVPTAIGNSAKSGAAKVKDWVTPDSKPASTGDKQIEPMFAAKKKMGPELYVATAAVYEKANRYEEAADQYEKALKVAPNHLVTMLSYAHMLDRQGRLEQASQIYVNAVKTHPKEAAAHNDLGLCYARRGMPAEAIQSLTKATELMPNRELYRNNLASVLVEQNKSDEALAQLKAVHGEAIAHYNLGYLLQQRGREQLAASHFQRAAMLDPSLMAARQWADQIMARGATPQPIVAAGAGNPGSLQVASVPAPSQRAASYNTPPEPGPAPNYLRNEQPIGATSNNRYGSLLPPSPDQVGAYKPALGSDLQFLPPVE